MLCSLSEDAKRKEKERRRKKEGERKKKNEIRRRKEGERKKEKERRRKKKEERRRKNEKERTEQLSGVSDDGGQQTKGDMPHHAKASHWHVRCSLQERI